MESLEVTKGHDHKVLIPIDMCTTLANKRKVHKRKAEES
jgi:hypothetical protein